MKRRARRARNEQTAAEERWRPGVLHLLGLALLLSLIAAFLLRSHIGLRLGLPGAYVWVTVLFIAFGLQLANAARFVLPPEAEQQGGHRSDLGVRSGQGSKAAMEVSWTEGMRMIVYHFAVMTLPERLRGSFHRRREDLPPAVPPSFSEFQAGFVDSYLALALARGRHFTRAAGPGYVRLRRGERITHVIDLRPQRRREEIEVVTRDGITLQTSVTVTFRVRRAERQPLDAVPYPYDENHIFQLTYAGGVGADGDIPWSERISPLAASLLIAEVARYRLDQIVLQEDDAVSMKDIVDEIQRHLASELVNIFDCGSPENCPVEIMRLGVGHLEPPEEVIAQRIRNWQSAWEKVRIKNEAEVRATEISTIRQARAAALVDMLESVTCKISEIRTRDRDTLTTMFMVRVSEMLDRLIADHDEALDRPQELFDSLLKASAWLKELTPSRNLFGAVGALPGQLTGGASLSEETPPPQVSERLRAAPREDQGDGASGTSDATGDGRQARGSVAGARQTADEGSSGEASPPAAPRYRPASAKGLVGAALLAFLLYWLFVAFQLQAVDLSQPPPSWLILTERLPLLSFVPASLAAFLATAFSPRILRHVLIPGILGVWMANEAAVGFIKSFYGFPSRSGAGAFLSRLKSYQPQRPSASADETADASAGPLRRFLDTADRRTQLRLALALTVITLPFASTVLLLAFFSYLLPPTPERRLLYNALVVVLGGLWVAIMALYALRSISNLPPAPGGLVLEREALQEMRREHTLLRVGGPGKIVAPDSDAVVTEYNGRFYRVLSPGVQSLLPFEYVRAMIDLRQQEREGQAAGVTQDGITVRSRLAVTFRIHSDDLEPQGANVRGRSRQPTGRPPTREEPYPYSERAVYQAAYAESVGAQGRVSTWTQLPVAIAGGAFGRALAQTKLDQIFDPEARADAPHPLLLDRVGQATDETLDNLGIRLVTLRMERLRAPEPVDDVNVRGWRSHWETVQQMDESKERATAAREVERARTEAEVVMLQAIADAMEKARQGGSAALVQEIVALRLLEALERVAQAAKKETGGGDDVLDRFGEMQRELTPPESNT